MVKVFLAEGFRIVSGGTDNHLMLVDVKSKGLNGKIAQNILDEVNITVNKNTIPFETESPFVTSGIRIGTPACTTRGFKEPEFTKVAQLIVKTLTNIKGDQLAENIRSEVKAEIVELCAKFPLYKA